MAREVLGYGQPKRSSDAKLPEDGPAEPPRAPEGFPDEMPMEAIIRVNVACNQHCFFCNTNARAQNLHESPAKVRRFIEENKHVHHMSFSGGEPTINPHLLGYIRYARDLGVPRIVVQTNAMLSAYDEFADQLVEAGLTAAFVSLHAPRAKVSDKVTATPGSWEVTLKGIRNLLDRGIDIELNTVINGYNYPYLAEHARFVIERFPDIQCISLSYVAPTGFCVVNRKNIPRIRDVQPHLFEALEIFREAGILAKIPDRCGIPLCTLRGYEEHHEAVLSWPFSGNGIVTDDHMKHEGCKDCVWDDRCIGYWKKCVDLWGTEDLVPVTEPVDVDPEPLWHDYGDQEAVRRFLAERDRRIRALEKIRGDA